MNYTNIDNFESRISNLKSDYSLNIRKLAHDIRSPLTTLRLLKTKNCLKESFPESQLVLQAIDRIEKLSQKMTADYLSKEADHQVEPKRASWSSLLLVQEICSDISLKNKRAVVSLAYKNTSQYNILASRVEMTSILTNILNNSIEACCGLKPKVGISFYENIDRVDIKIKDNGCGVTATEKKYLFQDKKSFNKNYGCGLALFAAQRYLSSIKGDIDFKSEKGNWTEVTLKIPKK